MTRGAVVFDFDGVLADTERLHLSAFQRALAPHDIALTDAEYFERYLGYDDRGLILALARDRGLSIRPADLDALLAAKAGEFATLVAAGGALFEGAPGCIARLGEHYPLAIASGALHEEIVTLLDGAGLATAFVAIVGADDVEASKPAPDPYLEAVRRLDIAPSRAVAVEDSRWGLESARAAGLVTIGLTTSYPAGQLGPADVVIPSLDDLTPALVARLLPAADNR